VVTGAAGLEPFVPHLKSLFNRRVLECIKMYLFYGENSFSFLIVIPIRKRIRHNNNISKQSYKDWDPSTVTTEELLPAYMPIIKAG
jgi:hypothetical protein